jgi:hypothetical protein
MLRAKQFQGPNVRVAHIGELPSPDVPMPHRRLRAKKAPA